MKKPLVLAHRGFSGKYPENSPIAFKAAVEQTNCDGFESDVHLTKDGVPVIFHDAVLERTSNGRGALRDYTYDELLQLDIGTWKGKEFAGERIWTLSQLLDFCNQTGKVLNLELKNYEIFYEGLEEKVIQTICAFRMQSQVFVSSFNHISMQRFKHLCGDIQTGLLYDKPLLNMASYVQGSNADNMHPRHLLLQYESELVQLFHGRGMGVHTWTVNEEQDMRCMIALGVDSIITNHPDVLCGILSK